MKLYNFDTDFAMSRRYEHKFADWLRSKGVVDVEVAPDDEPFHDWDVASVADTYEIKYDRWFAQTGNILIETYSDEYNHSLGWFYKTKADWLIIFFSETEFIGMPMEHLRDVWFDMPSIWKKAVVNQSTGSKSICWLAPYVYFYQLKRFDIS